MRRSEGRRGVPGNPESDQDRFSASWYARVACESADEDDADGTEGRERAGLATPTREYERDHERGVHNRQYGYPDQEPSPPRHRANLCLVRRSDGVHHARRCRI
jgi:hypothetical protein